MFLLAPSVHLHRTETFQAFEPSSPQMQKAFLNAEMSFYITVRDRFDATKQEELGNE